MPCVSACCGGEACVVCGLPAEHKIGEEIFFDDPFKNRHNLTAYVCRKHFLKLFGEWGVANVEITREHILEMSDDDRKRLGIRTGKEG